jgi:hypothetical protein
VVRKACGVCEMFEEEVKVGCENLKSWKRIREIGKEKREEEEENPPVSL